MDFAWSEGEQTFRSEVRAFLHEHWDAHALPDSEEDDDALWETIRAFRRRLADDGWLTMAWPAEYGGRGASFMQQMIFKEECVIQRAPVSGGAEDVLAPALMIHGSEELRRRFLPPIARAEMTLAQGYSEPSAGSDLASLTTRAVRDGDEYVINGQKIWSSGAHRSDWMHVLVRTDGDAPKHRGISYLLMDLSSPGILIRPIPVMHGRGAFNEVFFEDVRVPASQRIGEENRGWYIAMTALDFERSGVHLVIGVQRAFEDLRDYATEPDSDGSGRYLAKRQTTRLTLADTRIELEVARLLSYRITSMQSHSLVPNYEASAAKTFGTELIQRHACRAINLLGQRGMLRRGSPHAVLDGTFASGYMSMIGQTIAGGTSEIQRNVIATRGLGLPRGS